MKNRIRINLKKEKRPSWQAKTAAVSKSSLPLDHYTFPLPFTCRPFCSFESLAFFFSLWHHLNSHSCPIRMSHKMKEVCVRERKKVGWGKGYGEKGYNCYERGERWMQTKERDGGRQCTVLPDLRLGIQRGQGALVIIFAVFPCDFQFSSDWLYNFYNFAQGTFAY